MRINKKDIKNTALCGVFSLCFRYQLITIGNLRELQDHFAPDSYQLQYQLSSYLVYKLSE